MKRNATIWALDSSLAHCPHQALQVENVRTSSDQIGFQGAYQLATNRAMCCPLNCSGIFIVPPSDDTAQFQPGKLVNGASNYCCHSADVYTTSFLRHNITAALDRSGDASSSPSITVKYLACFRNIFPGPRSSPHAPLTLQKDASCSQAKDLPSTVAWPHVPNPGLAISLSASPSYPQCVDSVSSTSKCR
ncbi:hypothetical protein R1flu_020081 [Riccia fluitans]|uniref:Uncharacterized protein n=1 Tax=Riccia fluitans TaxID=41844 RepID=A0ABD1ZKJ1_9MARC